MTAALNGVPMDTFAIRLAVVRAVMGWNYDQAARATGLGSETWRTWEKGTRRCTDIVGAASRISEGTGGVVSRDWLILGGPLAQEPALARDLPRRRQDSGVRHEGLAGRPGRSQSVTNTYSRRCVRNAPRFPAGRDPRLVPSGVARRGGVTRDEWRIRDLPGSHELPNLLMRHARNVSACQRVAA
jgi:hypothetical protein